MRTGLEELLRHPRRYLQGGRVGLVANPTTVNHELISAVQLLSEHPDIDLRLLFGPEHGLHGVAQDMISVEDQRDLGSGLPVRSLYGLDVASLTPRLADLRELDVLVFDLQDIGCRYYTYAATMALCMQATGAAGIRIVVLDRPNPIGGAQVEGGGLLPGMESFVGWYPVPQRHGLTLGELARLYQTTFHVGCALEVVPCVGWQRQQYFDATGLPWVMPSPNMPTLDTAIVYPGMCLLEGTNLSEGRGTTRPFELCGAPFVDGRALASLLADLSLPGVRFRPCWFRPTFHKFSGQTCGGVQLHVLDRRQFLPYRTGLAVLFAVRRLWPEQFAWRAEAYEFRQDVPAIDLLTGHPAVRQHLDSGESFDRVVDVAGQGLTAFSAGRAQALLYE